MSDNTTLNAGSGGDVISTDDIAGVKVQRIKVQHGADGSATDVSTASPLPVTLANTGANATAVKVDGSAVTQPVSDGSGSLTVDNAGTFAVQATLAAETTKVIGTVNIAASQTVATVTAVTAITNALPAGTNAIGKLAANSGVDIGDVDVTTVGTITPGTGATSLGKAEDAAHTSGDVGVLMLGVRQDADTSPVSASGDYQAPLFDANGYLKVNIKAGAGSGGTALADAATFTRGTTSETPIAGVVETSAPTLTNGQAGAISLTTGGAVRVAVASGGIAGIAEDSASAGGEDGVMMLAVRRDSASSGVSADGDFAALSVTSDGSLRVSGSSGTTQYTEDGASAGAESLCLVGAVRRDTAASSSGTDGDYSTVNTDANGKVWTNAELTKLAGTAVDVNSGNKSAGTLRVVLATDQPALTNKLLVTPDSVALPANQSVNVSQINGVTTSMGNGISGTGVQRVTIASDSTGQVAITGTVTVASHAVTNAGTFAVQESGTQVQADDSAFTPATSKVTMAGFTADETATDSVDEGDGGAARMTLDRKQIVTEYAHAAAGGGSSYSAISAAAVLTAQIKGSAGKVYSIQIFNLNAAARYVRLYDQTGAPASTDGANIVWRGIIPGNTAGAGFVVQFPKGKQFATGIGIRVSAAVADNDTTVLAANEQFCNVDYV